MASPIPVEYFKRHRGRIFSTEINDRLTEVMRAYESYLEPSDGDSPAISQKKREKIEKLYRYKSEINPLQQYNALIKNVKYTRACKLTLDMLDEFLDAMGWSLKHFLEVCMKENRNFTPKECISSECVSGWTELEWYSKDAKTMADALDNMDDSAKDSMDKLVTALLPKSFHVLEEHLLEDSWEYGRNDEQLPEHIQENIEEYVREKKIDNMGDRIHETILYKFDDSYLREKIASDFGLSYDFWRVKRPRHYWTFSIEEMKKLCDGYKLSPHWFFCGNEGETILAKSAATERIMDKFQFLSAENQAQVAATAVMLNEVK